MQTAVVKWVQGEQFQATTPSGHAVPFDGDRQRNAAPGMMEMLLAALGGCTGADVVSILAKQRQQLDSLEIEVSGERADSHPRVWTRIEVVYRLRGRLEEKAVARAIELSLTKYCSVTAMLAKTAAVSHRYEILPPEPA
jgi:putative redox protein